MRVREQQARRRRYAYVQPHNDRRETSTGEDEDEGDMTEARGEVARRRTTTMTVRTQGGCGDVGGKDGRREVGRRGDGGSGGGGEDALFWRCWGEMRARVHGWGREGPAKTPMSASFGARDESGAGREAGGWEPALHGGQRQ